MTGASPSSRIYTFDEDFDSGTLDNVNHDAPNNHQLQLNQRMTTEPYLWVANFSHGTVTKIDTRTGRQVAKYDSVLQANWDGSVPVPVVRPPRETTTNTANAPCGNSPSRTAVDSYGDAFVANRTFCGYPSATKYAGDVSRCVDRNGNGRIDTSSDVNGNGLIELSDPAEFKGQADECILWTKNYGRSKSLGRSMAVDADQNVWVGTYVDSKLFKLDGQTGAQLQELDPNVEKGSNANIYGIAIGPGGFIYTSDPNTLRLRKIDPNPALQKHVVGELQSPYGTYGIAVDRNGVVWLGKWANGGGIVRADFRTGVVTIPGAGGMGGCSGRTRGAAVDGDGNVWATCWDSNLLMKFSADGTFLGSWPVAEGPIGVGIDADGKVWTANYTSDSATRFDPATGTTQSFPTSGTPYSYSDMTGFQQRNVTLRQGHWAAVHDSGVVGTRWGTVTWNTEPRGSTPTGTSITVEVRAADDRLQLAALPFVAVPNGVEFGGVQGRYVEIRATLKIEDGNTSPVLSDLRIEPANVAPVALCKGADVCNEGGVCFANASIDNGSYDPDGDPITLAQLPLGPYPVGSRDVTLAVSDGTEVSVCTAPVTVRDCEPPTIACPPPVTMECVAGGSVVDMVTATASDNCAVVSVTDPPRATYPLGTTPVPYTAVDPAGLSASCTSAVTVRDTLPPRIDTPEPEVTLGPSNHKLLPFTLSSCAKATDLCQGTIDVNAAGTITAIYSDEPEDVDGQGDGHTRGDIVITGRSSFELRAERQGGGNGRVYGVTFQVADASGNVSTGKCQFVVQHDQSGRPAVDDGPSAGYTVTAP